MSKNLAPLPSQSIKPARILRVANAVLTTSWTSSIRIVSICCRMKPTKELPEMIERSTPRGIYHILRYVDRPTQSSTRLCVRVQRLRCRSCSYFRSCIMKGLWKTYSDLLLRIPETSLRSNVKQTVDSYQI